MNYMFTFASSAYYFEITGSIPTLTPSNVDSVFMTTCKPTVTRTSNNAYSTAHTFGGLTRYFRIKVGSTVIMSWKVKFTEKTAHSLSKQSGTLSATLTSTVSFGDCMKYCVSQTDNNNLRLSCDWGTNTSYGLTDVRNPIEFLGWTFDLGIVPTFTPTSGFNYQQFGNVVGFCSWSVAITNNSTWSYTAGSQSPKTINLPITTLKADNVQFATNVSVGSSATKNFGTVKTPNISTTIGAINQYIGELKNYTLNKSVQDYSKPEITSCSVKRNSSSSERADLSVTYKLHSLNKTSSQTSNVTANNATIYYQFYNGTTSMGNPVALTIVSDGSTLSSLTGTKTTTTAAGSPTLNVGSSYTCKVWVVDRLGGTSTVQEITIPTEFRTIDFKAGGTGVAIGEVASKNGFEVAMPSMFTTMAGTIQMYAGSTPPAGWLKCDGTSYLRTSYPTLFTALGGTSSPWGLPDSTHFNVPDLRGRVPLGAGSNSANTVTTYGSCSAGTVNQSLGKKGGEAAHTLKTEEAAQKAVSTNGMSANESHTHSVGFGVVNRASGSAGTRMVYGYNTTSATDSVATSSTSIAHTHSITGSDATTAHNNIQPYTVVNYIICTGQLPN